MNYFSVNPRMPELNLIIPYCCIQGKYCAYDMGLFDGYILGIATILMLFMIIQCVKGIEEVCDGPVEAHEPEEVTHEEDDECVDEVEEQLVDEEKSEEDKKDD